MNKPYAPESLDRLHGEAWSVLQPVIGKDCPPHVRATILLRLVQTELESYGRKIPVGLMPTLDIVTKTHAVYVRLCTEGLEQVS